MNPFFFLRKLSILYQLCQTCVCPTLCTVWTINHCLLQTAPWDVAVQEAITFIYRSCQIQHLLNQKKDRWTTPIAWIVTNRHANSCCVSFRLSLKSVTLYYARLILIYLFWSSESEWLLSFFQKFIWAKPKIIIYY